MDVLTELFSAPISRGPYADLAAWLARARACPHEDTIARALWGGLHADRLGYAFAAGYGAALVRLMEHAGLPRPTRTLALAATEAGGGHPRAIHTRLDGHALRGDKTFVTLATVTDELLVVATRGHGDDGKSQLVVVRVPRDARGLVLTPRPEAPFAPEIPHALARLDDVVVADEDVLPGDGYARWLKPFRTVEDLHVLAATVGYLSGVARAHGWGHAASSELAALGVALLDLGRRDPASPTTHLLVAGAFGAARRLLASLEPAWAKVDEEERTRWQRDAPLLLVAESARAKRTEAALRSLGLAAP